MEERIKAHYVSPMVTEDETSVEDMLSEIPDEDLQEVGIVQGRIFMPLSFAQKWILFHSECEKHYPSMKTKAYLVGSKQLCCTPSLISRSSISLDQAAM